MVLLASCCGLRLGELTELRRSDVDLGDGVIRVRRAMVCVRGEFRVTTPKSEADIRDVNIPPHLLPTADHMASHVGVDQDALVFPARHGGHLAPGTLYEAYYRRAEVVAVRASLRRVRDPLPGRRLHQLAQHMYKPYAANDSSVRHPWGSNPWGSKWYRAETGEISVGRY